MRVARLDFGFRTSPFRCCFRVKSRISASLPAAPMSHIATEENPSARQALTFGGIYRQDVLTFLTHPEVEQWRVVSRLSNSIIESVPEWKLPRRRVDRFYVSLVSSEYRNIFVHVFSPTY